MFFGGMGSSQEQNDIHIYRTRNLTNRKVSSMDSACNSLLNVSFHKTLSQKHFNSIGLQKQLVCICHEE